MAEMENHGKTNGIKRLILGAQDSAIGFYQKFGYQVFGDGYDEEGVAHHNMQKML